MLRMTGQGFSKWEATDVPDMEFLPNESEICFQVPASGELRLDLKQSGPATLDYLKFCVARNPADLLSHMRRIILAGKSGDSENLYAALIDLFITLASKGESLRSRLLKQYRPALSLAQYTRLAGYVAHGTDGEKGPVSSSSVFETGIIGTCSLVRRVSGQSGRKNFADPLREAREHLEYSQIEAAREVLERAVLEDPGRVDLQMELLELYRAARDIENYKRTFKRLNRSGRRFSDRWAAASKSMSENL